MRARTKHGLRLYRRGCRCDVCRKANTDAQRERRAAGSVTTVRQRADDGVASATFEADWMRSAECARPEHVEDLWFATDPAPAVAVCQRCVVRGECLAFALEWGIGSGVWGGMTPVEREIFGKNSRKS